MEYVWLALGGVALCATLHYGMDFVAFLSMVLHEGGHFLMAKILGIPVPVFSMGPEKAPYRVVGHAYGTELRWSKQWILGAYVGVTEQPLFSAPRWQRMLVHSGGILANILVGIGCILLAWHLWPTWADLGITRVSELSFTFLFGFFNWGLGILALVDHTPGSDGYKIRQEYRNWRAGK
jgi:membrane-associated protease RseP (regulator of RpoE activity)